MNKISWIQLSDLHFGHNSPFCKKSQEALKSFVLEHCKGIDYIFITGDIIYAADAKDSKKRKQAYQRAEHYLKDICASLWDSIELDQKIIERVFIVPGNHDLVRDMARADLMEQLPKKYIAEPDGKIDASYLANTQKAMEPFCTFYKKFASKDNWTKMQSKMHFVIETDYINVLHINTCISSSGNNDDGKLIVGYDLINEALSSIQNSKPTIAIAHHNFDFLDRQEQRKLELALKDKDVCLFLCGHAHKRESNLIVHYNQRKILNTYTCGTLMAEDEGNREINTTVFLGEMDTDSQCGRISSYIWDLDNGWHEDADFGLVQDIKGNYRFFDSNKFADGNTARLLTDGAKGITAHIVAHQSIERHKPFLELNSRAETSLSIYGIGITSVSPNTELFTQILRNGGMVQLCMVDPEIFKSSACGGSSDTGQTLQACTLGKTKFCIYRRHINEYMRPAYYRSMKDSYKRLKEYQEAEALKLPGKFTVKVLRSFIPMSINIINEFTDKAELITEYNMPFQEKRLLLQLSKQENESYYAHIKELFDTIWEKAVYVKW